MMFRIKICGVTRPGDAAAIAEAGADAIGLNFYEKSKRYVELGVAREIARSVTDGPIVVGVFVNASAERIAELVQAVPLDAIQLHGDERPHFALELPVETPVIRAVRMTGSGLIDAAEQFAALRRAGRPFRGILVDAAGDPGEYGGTGRLADWERFAEGKALVAPTPALLAGGLTPDNVAAAITATGCDGVDTASGVESAPGVKDRRMCERFVSSALAAWNS